MSTQVDQKPKVVAIRATQAQTALLKAAYSVSHSPPSKAIAELSQQTGLPGKWISNWFGRQRSKSRRNGEIIDLTMSSSASTITPRTATPAEQKPENIASLLSEQPSSSSPAPGTPMSATTTKAKAAKAPRKRPPRATKPKPKPRTVVKPEPQEAALPTDITSTTSQARPPQLLPSVMSPLGTQGSNHPAFMHSHLPVPPPTRSGMASRPQPGSIYSPETTKNTYSPSTSGVYSSTGHFTVSLRDHAQPNATPRQGPSTRRNFRNPVSNGFYSEAASSPVASSPYQKDLDIESQMGSSPAPRSEYSGFTSTAAPVTTGPTPAPVPPFMPPIAQGSLVDQKSLRNIHSQALAAYTTMYNNHPSAYQAMLLNYATLFPAILPAITGALAASGSFPRIPESETPALAPPAFAGPTFGGQSSADLGVPLLPSSPLLPPVPIDNDDALPAASSYDSVSVTKEIQETPWNSGSDYLDFSSLHYDYAPYSHLEERLQPFRLPESTYLFGREGVVNHLLDERLAVEEPFQAAMGLVLLSKLGLEW
ncbi:hypothetical protein AN958_06959 [Leucoagaricus sp. SymC.cos]|nr:hypothetical protein AN958_06959 [Leucoagaricus sp. SymC.cos]